jgi:hypothetical protein
LTIDSKDQIHAVFRQTRIDPAFFGGTEFSVLAYQKYDASEFTAQPTWSSPKVLVYPNEPNYSIYYHHLVTNRNDGLYLEYSQWHTFLPYFDPVGKVNLIGPFTNTALLRSMTSGVSWDLVSDSDVFTDQQWVPDNVFIGNTNADSIDEVVYLHHDTRTNISIYKSVNGPATLLRQSRLPDGSAIRQYPARAGDVNGDRLLDISFMTRDNTKPNELTIRTKQFQSDGSLQFIDFVGDVSNVIHSGQVFMGDVDGDHNDEFIFLYRDTGQLKCTVLKLNLVSRSFTASTIVFTDGTVVDSLPALIGDFNGDGRKDIVFFGVVTGSTMQLRYRLSLGLNIWDERVENIAWHTSYTQFPALAHDADGNRVDDITFQYRNGSNQFLATTLIKSANLTSTVRQKIFPDGTAIDQLPAAAGKVVAGSTHDWLVKSFWSSDTALNIRNKDLGVP